MARGAATVQLGAAMSVFAHTSAATQAIATLSTPPLATFDLTSPGSVTRLLTRTNQRLIPARVTWL